MAGTKFNELKKEFWNANSSGDRDLIFDKIIDLGNECVKSISEESHQKRLDIASRAMTGILSNADTMKELTKAYNNRPKSEKEKGFEFEHSISKLSLLYADSLIKQSLK